MASVRSTDVTACLSFPVGKEILINSFDCMAFFSIGYLFRDHWELSRTEKSHEHVLFEGLTYLYSYLSPPMLFVVGCSECHLLKNGVHK